MGNQIKSVGIIGAGQMGGGIAHVFALAGYDVWLNDIAAEQITTALSLIDKNLERQVGKRVIDPETAKSAQDPRRPRADQGAARLAEPRPVRAVGTEIGRVHLCRPA